MVNRTRREEERTWPSTYRRPPCLRHSGSSSLSTGTSGRTRVPFPPRYRVPSSAPRPTLPRTRALSSLPSPGLRQPELCLTILSGGALGRCTLHT
jgi:hypothetical protein